MAKVKSPLMSTGARGSIGRSLTYTSALKRGIVKGFFVSKDKGTAEQLIIRSVFNEGVNVWRGLSEGEKEVYRIRAEGKLLTGYNIFIKEYMNNNYPPAERGIYEKSYYENCSYAEN